ncbi:translation initiation factor IF-2 [Sphaerochaeta sp. S2]|uniref:translation initiation factor IF-2 n=1 Tax=Sphaerochaeta sp. S2 TaxID=2798868 RepID=UPI0018E9A711|nr:translation initiation factor IF-2 [Sphaerochaeta sp. S2]MBJ2357306.1 translation initiation factor IF-2 [Sphaerochaeta sp. S2]
MSEENNKPKATLIKHVVNPTEHNKEQKSPAKEPESKPKAPAEKRRVVVVKKKVVVVKPQARKEAEKPENEKQEGKKTSKDEGSKEASEKKKTASDGRTSSVVRKAHRHSGSENLSSSPLHNGPVVIRPTNLPPVPNQGLTVKDHKELQDKNPGGISSKESPVPSSGPRVAGMVGGRPAPGTRPQFRPNNNRGGYQGQDNRGPARPAGAGGYQGQDNRGPARPGGYRPNPNGPARGGAPFQRSGGGVGFRGPGGPRPPFGGPQGRGGNRPPMQDMAPVNQRTNKKSFKKKNNATYKKRNAEEEKEFQIQRRKQQAAAKLAAVPKSIDMMEVITVSDLAKKMNLKAGEIIAKLLKMGMMVTINQQIDHETAEIICSEYNCQVNLVSLYDETLIVSDPDKDEDLINRAPIVTVMGHVDHGKTKLLDAIRSTKVAEGEYGGITQHIGAYKVDLPGKGEVVFLDTPGHAAFSMMRARGAQVTDIVILVVAANDGVMPQTREAIDHARAANVPIIVAINKCDLPEAKPERVMQQLSDLGLMPEAWGGQTLYCEISALKKIGIDELLDTILLEAEMLELKVNANCRAEGKIIESRIDQGRGIVASILIERGTLRQGDHYVAGIYPGRVRAMFDDKGKKIEEAGPSTPVEIIGLSDIPGAGDPFQVTEDERQARQVGNKRQELERIGDSRNVKKVTLDNLYTKIKEGTIQEFNVIIKGDVQGSVEALQGALQKLSNDEIHLNVIRASAGAIIESDVTLASASEALVIGFNVRPTPRAQVLADQEKIEIRKYNIIYDVVDDIRSAMEGMLSPEVHEVEIGTVEVRDTFKVPRIGTIAGCMVTSGKVKRNAYARVFREDIQLTSEKVKISSLKRFKDDAREVAEGFECGIGLENFNDLHVGDILEIIETEEIARKLVSKSE